MVQYGEVRGAGIRGRDLTEGVRTEVGESRMNEGYRLCRGGEERARAVETVGVLCRGCRGGSPFFTLGEGEGVMEGVVVGIGKTGWGGERG